MRPHGDYVRYSQGCRCGECRAAWNLYRRGFRRAVASFGRSEKTGGRMRLDAEDARELACCMVGFGIARRRIAGAMGKTKGTAQLICEMRDVAYRTEPEMRTTFIRQWGNSKPAVES